MFTGIISKTAKVSSVHKTNDGMILEVWKPKGWKIEAGNSISVNGVCSTVKGSDSNLIFEYMPETLVKSDLGSLRIGKIVNLEQSLRLSDTLDGHIVTGHVDCVGTIKSIIPEGNSLIFTINIPETKLLAKKGSVCVDGISLTIVNVETNCFTVKIIPYTMEHTNFQDKKKGDTVNVEFDILAKYVERILKESVSRWKEVNLKLSILMLAC